MQNDENQNFELYRKLRITGNSNNKSEKIFSTKNYSWYNPQSCIEKLRMNSEHNIFSLTFTKDGSDKYITCFKILNSDTKFSNKFIENCSGAETLENSNKPEFLLLINDSKNRPYQIKYLNLENFYIDPKPLFTENDPKFCINLYSTKDQKFAIINSESMKTTEIHIISKNDPNSMKCLISRSENKHIFIDHCENKFIMLEKSKNSQNYDVFIIPDTNFSQKIKIYSIPNENVLENYDILRDFLILYTYKNGIPEILIYNFNDNKISTIKFIDQIGEIFPYANSAYNENKIKFKFSNPFNYEISYQLNLLTRKLTKINEISIISPMNTPKSNFSISTYFSKSKDNTEIPITILENNNSRKNAENKLLLYSYGAYGIRTPLNFNIINYAALEQNWKIGFAHIRGSNFKGNSWHQSACFPNKQKSVEDLMSCLKFLYYNNIAQNSKTALCGSSAGATFIGQIINLEQNICKAVLMRNPFLDIFGILSDPNQPLNDANFEEWGNPLYAKNQILNISPYENIISNVKYPDILLTYSKEDSRIPFWSVLKYIEKIQDLAPKSEILSLIEEGGHFGNMQDEENLKQRIWEFSWIDYVLSK